MKRKWIIAIPILVLTISFMACGSKSESSGTTDSASGANFKIGVHVKTMGNPVFREAAWGAVERGKILGVDITPAATARDGQLDEQIQQIEDLLIKGVDALVVTPQDSKGIVPAVLAAQRANVPFIAVDTAVEGAEPDCFIEMDNVQAGYDLAKVVCEKIGGRGNVIILQGVAGASTSIRRTQGYLKALAEYPNIRIVGNQNADFDQAKGQQVTADLLQANKDIRAVLSCGDLMALGAIVSLEEAGYKLGGNDGVIIGSYDICAPILQAVKDGKVYVEGYHWSQLYGQWGVDMAVRILNGQPVPKYITSPHSLITAENVDTFLEFAKAQEVYKFNM
jgi:ABC-type sugar transport system substrate-binding protein